MLKKLFTAAWVALLFTFCHLAAAATNVSVTATPSNPTAPATVTLAASGDSDGNPIMVTKVEYFNGTTSLGVSVQSPFTLTLNNLAAGTYQISVKVTTTDPANPVLQSAPLAVTVGTAPGAATAYFIHTDQLNTPRAITDGNGNLVWQWDSDPFGKDVPNEQPVGQPAFAFNQRFPGQQIDRESNLHYNYFRDYDPQTGRYIQSDPIGMQAGPNTYAYVGGDPISYQDPEGLMGSRGNPGYSGPSTPTTSGWVDKNQIVIGPVEVSITVKPGGKSVYVGLRAPGVMYSNTMEYQCKVGDMSGLTLKGSAGAGWGAGVAGSVGVSTGDGKNGGGAQASIGIQGRTKGIWGISPPSPGIGWTFK